MAKNHSGKITRRNFSAICAGTAVAAATGLKDVSPPAGLTSTSGCPQTTGVDQNPIRRRRTGLQALDATRASAGLTLFTPLFDDGTIYLIDLLGKLVHSWKMPYSPGLYGYLTEKSTLFYNGKIPNDTFLGQAPFKGGVALEADWNGKVL
jgi:hypothetical protein